MMDENKIGLAELIEQVKRELLFTSFEGLAKEETKVPLFSVDSVELELQVTVKKEGKAGIKIYVLDVGGSGSRDDVQTVKVSLSPLLPKEMLLEFYKKRYPGNLQEFVTQSLEALTKGSDGDLASQFGS